MADANNPFGLSKMVPGFDYLQSLAKNATGNIPQMPNLANWVAPTLNTEELDKRIEELKQVQFWLDQNAKALAAVVQALEVQKMTLATLKGMNFNMGDMANAFKLKAADTMMGGVKQAVRTGKAAGKAASSAAKTAAKTVTGKTPTPQIADPSQWWASLSKQFGEIANNTLRETGQKNAMDAARNTAVGLAKGAMKAAQAATKSGAALAGSAAQNDKKTAKKVVRKTATKTTPPRAAPKRKT